jgi:hypothetical protein
MTIEAASATAPAAARNVEDASAAVSDDPAFDRLFGRDADGAPLWLRTEELLRIDDGGNADDDVDNVVDAVIENGENKNEETAASDGGKKKSKDAFEAEAYIAEAKKLVSKRKKKKKKKKKKG